jgi:putative membrane protein
LYNGFLAVGLLWGLLSEKADVVLYFLVCVVIAGIYGSFSTKNIRLFYVQAVPALLALAMALLI